MKKVNYKISDLNKLLQKHGSLMDIAPFVINTHNGEQGASYRSLHHWIKRHGYYVDLTRKIRRQDGNKGGETK